ncbi:MAG: hypothetical protein R3346_03345 [Candidatus Spechtbacterales bacterium]|nr:hypothetical protein [Candidatus Spechtbacterales bacterium]
MVPPGALHKQTDISAEKIPEELYVPGPLFAEPIGGVAFGPSGLSFKKPITVTIPLKEQYEPGTELPLFLLNEEEQYIDTRAVATVLSDGKTAEAEIEHFSKYVLFKGWEKVKAKLSRPNLGNPNDIKFMDEMVELLGNLYDTGPGQEHTYKGQCYRIVGAGYNLNIQENGNEGELMQEYYNKYKNIGKKSSHPQNITRIASVAGSVSRIKTIKGGGQDPNVLENFDGEYALTVEIILEPCKGEFVIKGFEITPQIVEPGKQVGIFAQVMNTGESTGKRTVEISVGNAVELSREIELDPNQYTDLLLDVVRNIEGVYAVKVDAVEAKESGSFEVKKPEQEAASPDSRTGQEENRTWGGGACGFETITLESAAIEGGEIELSFYPETTPENGIVEFSGGYPKYQSSMRIFPASGYEEAPINLAIIEFGGAGDDIITMRGIDPETGFQLCTGTFEEGAEGRAWDLAPAPAE